MFCLLRNSSVSQPRSGSRATSPSLGTLQVSSYQGVKSTGNFTSRPQWGWGGRCGARGKKKGAEWHFSRSLAGWEANSDTCSHSNYLNASGKCKQGGKMPISKAQLIQQQLQTAVGLLISAVWMHLIAWSSQLLVNSTSTDEYGWREKSIQESDCHNASEEPLIQFNSSRIIPKGSLWLTINLSRW